jgi:hypothetical protein
MGLFDTVRCDYPLPVPGANLLSYQTKSLDLMQATYHIAINEQLLLIERGRFAPEPDTPTTTAALSGTPVSDFIGEIRFYSSWGPDNEGWIEWSAYFVRGNLRELHLIQKTDNPAQPTPCSES